VNVTLAFCNESLTASTTAILSDPATNEIHAYVFRSSCAARDIVDVDVKQNKMSNENIGKFVPTDGQDTGKIQGRYREEQRLLYRLQPFVSFVKVR
jgi:hypothetical protein